MKNIFAVTVLSLMSILLVTACSQTPRSPADEVVKLDKSTLEQQKVFDQAMINKEKTLSEKNGINK
ncbi:MAG: hypothetical protein WCK88_00445 [bacterium]